MKYVILNSERYNYDINGILWKINKYYVACLKNVLKFLVALIIGNEF